MRYSAKQASSRFLCAIIVVVIAAQFMTGCSRPPKPEIVRIKGYGTARDLGRSTVERPDMPAIPDLDWRQEEALATGVGAPPEEAMNDAQRQLMARRAAQLDAYRNLAEQIMGLQIDSSTTVRNFVTESDEINSRVQALIRGAQIVDEKELADGSWEVTMRLPLAPLASVVQEGYETVPPSPEGQPVVPAGQARAMARRAAQLDAHRNLLELVKGIQIDSSSRVQDFMLKDDRIRSRVEGVVRGARIVDVNYDNDICEVTLEFDVARVRELVR